MNLFLIQDIWDSDDMADNAFDIGKYFIPMKITMVFKTCSVASNLMDFFLSMTTRNSLISRLGTHGPHMTSCYRHSTSNDRLFEDCLFNSLFMPTSKETSKLRISGTGDLWIPLIQWIPLTKHPPPPPPPPPPPTHTHTHKKKTTHTT